MKKYACLTAAALAAFLCSCSDDKMGQEIVENPVQTGDEILFGSSLSGDGDMTESRTVYGERKTTGVPVYWRKEGDKVAIFCKQAAQPADGLVTYIVKPRLTADGEYDATSATSASVTKDELEDAGLQWGKEETHRFYAFYPASAVKGSEEEDNTGKITASIPVDQQVIGWQEGTLNGVKTYFGEPNMDYAYMYAFAEVNKSKLPEGKPIDLTFHNLITVLDITVPGPVSGDPIAISNINVEAIEGENPILTGDFTCNIRPDENGNPMGTCTPVPSQEVRNRISISCYDKATGGFIKIRQGEQLNVKAYIIPDDLNNTVTRRTLKVTVIPQFGASKTKILETADVTPHKINRVILPHMEAGGVNYWLSNLPSNVYLSELSIPGSKMSYLTAANEAENAQYQTQTIEQQFLDGVRAFIFQTGAKANYNWSGTKFENGTLYVAVNDSRKANIIDVLKDLKACIDEAKTGLAGKTMNEFAFVQLTYSAGATDDDHVIDHADEAWMKTVEYVLNNLKNDADLKDYIYTDPITPETTLADVSGKIVLKVNYNSDEQGSYIAADASVPALFTKWEAPYVEGGVPMKWGSPQAGSQLTWFYQEVTSVGSGKDDEATREEKEQYIRSLFQKSVDMYYDDNEHNTWFMNDLGGYYTGMNQNEGIAALTTDMNNVGVEELQVRKENASTGIVYMNFADKQSDSGIKYKSADLISTVVDNNFKFQMRHKETTPSTRSEYVTRLASDSDSWDE